MSLQKDQELAARLEQAHTLSNAQRIALLKDLERYAARDLYGASRLCKDHLSKDADLRLPLSIQVAPMLAKHFEMRMETQRRAVDLYFEQDKQMRQPQAGKQYVGPVVGTTPNCVVQLDNETGDLIVHAKTSLVCAFEAAERDKDLAIHYPAVAIGGVGLVTRMENGQQLNHGMTLSRDAHLSKTEPSLERSL